MVAITMVLLFHVATRYDTAQLDVVAQWFLTYGKFGVDLFFPLSGFLITGFLLRSQRPDYISAFFLRRVFRILPLYLLAVTTYVVASLVMRYELELLDRVWINYLFLTGWFTFFDGVETVPYTITWSLSVEEFAYIMFGLFAWINRKRFGLFIVGLIVFSTLLRFYLNAVDAGATYFFPPARLDSIALGALAALVLDKNRTLVLGGFLGAAAVTLACMQIGPLWFHSLVFTLISLVTCAAIVLFERFLRDPRGWGMSQIAAIGFYSYFIYLFHFFVIYGVFQIAPKLGLELPGFWITSGICYALTYGLAVMSYRWFEGPLIDFGRQFERRQSVSA